MDPRLSPQRVKGSGCAQSPLVYAVATDKIVRGRQYRWSSLARHRKILPPSGALSGAAARVTTPLTLASDTGGFAAWQARRQAFACHRACINRLGRPLRNGPVYPPGAHRHRALRGPALGVARLGSLGRGGQGRLDAGDSGSQKDRRRTTALHRLLHCNNPLVGRPQRAGSSGSSSWRSLRHTRTIRTCFGSRR